MEGQLRPAKEDYDFRVMSLEDAVPSPVKVGILIRLDQPEEELEKAVKGIVPKSLLSPGSSLSLVPKRLWG